jgi:hypothetical protein
MRYVPEVVMHHEPSVANVESLRPFGLRNTLWNCWLHRRWANAARWTAYTLWDRPKNRNWARGVTMAVAGLPWVLRERRAMSSYLDEQLAVLDRGKFRDRRSFFTFREGRRSASGRAPRADRASLSGLEPDYLAGSTSS